MSNVKPGNDSPKDNLRNFDLSVDEIKLMKTIDELNKSANNIAEFDPQSPRLKFFRQEIRKLEDQLEELRDNTLMN